METGRINNPSWAKDTKVVLLSLEMARTKEKDKGGGQSNFVSWRAEPFELQKIV